jgi:DNA replication protein DnaC
MSTRPPNDETNLEARVRRVLNLLHLPSLVDALPELLAWARKERPTPLALLDRALSPDADRTVARAIDRRLIDSGLPDRPTLETFDFAFQPSLDKGLVLELGELDFLRAHEDLVLTGQSGTGKSHIVKSVAVRACVAGVRMLYRQFRVLMDDLYAGLADNTFERRMNRYARVPFLVIDDVGLGRVRRSPDEPTAAHMLFTLVDRRVGRASTALTSNIQLSAWGGYLGDPALTMAILDRMIHHAIRIEIDGPSWRDKESQELNQKRRSSARARKTGAPPARSTATGVAS